MGFCPLGWGHWGARGGMGIIGPILGLVLFVAFLVLLAFAIRWLVRQSSSRGSTSAGGSDALEIAKRRLASGEISIQEFEEIQKRLRD